MNFLNLVKNIYKKAMASNIVDVEWLNAFLKNQEHDKDVLSNHLYSTLYQGPTQHNEIRKRNKRNSDYKGSTTIFIHKMMWSFLQKIL